MKLYIYVPDEVVELLADRPGGYFIYTSTVLKHVDEDYSSCIDRLRDVLEQTSLVSIRGTCI